MSGFLQRLAALAAIAGSILISMPHPARAVDPTEFAVVKTGTQDPPEVSLNGEVRIHLNTAAPDPKKLQLWLAGSPLGVEPRAFGDDFIFPLLRTSDNRELWSRLLGSPLSNPTRPVEVGIQYDKKPLKLTGAETNQTKVTLITYNGGLMTLGIILALAVAAVIVVAAWQTNLIKDRNPLVRNVADLSYSLGKLQMLVWTCLIFSSFAFIFAVTADINSLNAESFVLMGIAASTALAAVAIDQSKSAMPASVQSLGIKALQDVDNLYAGQAAAAARPTIAAATVPGAGGAAANTNPTFQELRTAYEAATRSQGFLKDIVNDADGPTIHRWQILLWTIVLGGIYVVKVYTSLETPTFGANLLALMGISGGTYLGFKIPEKQ